MPLLMGAPPADRKGGIKMFDAIVFEPLRDMMLRVAHFVPTLLLALAILIVGYVLAHAIEKLLTKVLRMIEFDKVMDKMGLVHILKVGEVKQKPSELIGLLTYSVLIITTHWSCRSGFRFNRYIRNAGFRFGVCSECHFRRPCPDDRYAYRQSRIGLDVYRRQERGYAAAGCHQPVMQVCHHGLCSDHVPQRDWLCRAL